MSNQIEKPKHIFCLKIGSWSFAPNFKLTVIVILLISILVYLGFWQIGRSHYKQNISQELGSKVQTKSVDLKSLVDPTLAKDRFTPVYVEGVYLHNYTILIDNQMHDHKVGYRVVTPMHVPRSENWVLIDRGWVPANKDRSQLPKIDVVFGLMEVQGIINNISSGIVLQKDKANDELKWPIVLQSLDYDLIAIQLHHPVYKFVVQLNENQPGAYVHAKTSFGLSSNKHLGYAVEWFFLALTVLIYYIVVSTKRSM